MKPVGVTGSAAYWRVGLTMDDSSGQVFRGGNEGEGNAVNYKPLEHCTNKQLIHARYSIYFIHIN